MTSAAAQATARVAFRLHVRLVRARALADRLPPLAVRRLVHAHAAARSLCQAMLKSQQGQRGHGGGHASHD